MPTGSPNCNNVAVTSSLRHHHLAAAVTTASSSSSVAMTTASLSGQPQLLSRTNLYIRGLKPETTDKDLVTLCQQLVYVSFFFCFFLSIRSSVQFFKVQKTPKMLYKRAS